MSLTTVACGDDEETGTTADATATTGDDAGATDGTDGTDGTDATDGTDGSEGTDGSDATDGTDSTDAPEPVTGCAMGEGKKCYMGDCCTCSGSPCSEGIDNQLSGIANLANGALTGSIDDGDVNIVAEFVGDFSGGAEFTMNMYTADLAPENTECDITTESCEWQLGLAGFTADCEPLIQFPNTKIEGNIMTAGGPDGVFRLAVPIQGFVLELVITSARIEATVEYDENDNIIGIEGILAGAIPKAGLEEAVDNLPEDGLPISKDAIKNILNNVIKNDIDGLDAEGNPGTDGVKESASVAVVFSAIPGNIVGVETPEEGAEGCTEPPTEFSTVAFRINELQLGASGQPGQGLDIDGICTEPVTDVPENIADECTEDAQ